MFCDIAALGLILPHIMRQKARYLQEHDGGVGLERELWGRSVRVGVHLGHDHGRHVRHLAGESGISTKQASTRAGGKKTNTTAAVPQTCTDGPSINPKIGTLIE